MEDEQFYQSFKVKVDYINKFQSNSISSNDILKVIITKLQIRKGDADKEDLEDLLEEIE